MFITSFILFCEDRHTAVTLLTIRLKLGSFLLFHFLKTTARYAPGWFGIFFYLLIGSVLPINSQLPVASSDNVASNFYIFRSKAEVLNTSDVYAGQPFMSRSGKAHASPNKEGYSHF